MKVYRICRKKYAEDLSGMGAFLNGGRWNSKGTYVIYTSENISLCTLEVRVHLPSGIHPKGFVLVDYEIPENDITDVENQFGPVPEGWNALNFSHPYSVQAGDTFFNINRGFILKVPSIVAPRQFNYLINPHHEKINQVRISEIVPYNFDHRLFA